MYWDDEFALGEYDNASWDIWDHLVECHWLWWGTYRQYWGLAGDQLPEHLTEQQWRAAKTTDSLAATTFKMAMALSVEGVMPPGRKLEFTQGEFTRLRRALRLHAGQYPQAKDRISFAVAEDALEQLKGSTDRVIRLVSLIRGVGLSPRASRYAVRAARLYVWGFEPECALMCRSVLEAALAARLAEFIDQDSAEPDLDQLLKLAGENQALDGYQIAPRSRKGWRARRGSRLWSAQRIQWTGNRAAHQFPVLGQDADDLPDAFSGLRELLLVLNHLFPLKP